MAQDDDFTIGGRKTRKSGSQGSPRPSTSKGGGNQSAIKLGNLSGGSMSFTKRLAKDMAIAKLSNAVGFSVCNRFPEPIIFFETDDKVLKLCFREVTAYLVYALFTRAYRRS